MKHNAITLFRALVIIAAFLSLHGCGGCVGNIANQSELSEKKTIAPTSGAKPENLTQHTEILPIEEKISSNAESTYAYLCFIHAINSEDEEALLQAAALFKTPEIPAAVWMEGGVWLMSRKSKNAHRLLEQAVAAWPEDLSLNLLFAEALMEGAMTQQGVALMRNYLQRHPDSMDARLELALLLVKNAEFHEAEKLLTDIPAKQRTPLVEYYHARALIGMERQGEAIVHLQKSIKEMPYFVEALAELAFIHERRSNFKEARNIYEQLLKLNFSPQDVVLRLIHLSLKLNQPEKALRYLRPGLGNLQFRLMAISMFIDSRHYLQAESLLKQIVAEGGAPGEVCLLLAELAYEQRRDISMSFAWLDKIPANSKVAGQAQLLRAQMLAESGKDEESLAIAQNGQRNYSGIPDFWDLEIRLLARRKQTAQALSVAQKALEKWPDNTDLNFLLGSLLDETGDKKNAFTVMENILKTQPDNYQALNYVGYTLAEENRDLERAVQLLVKADRLSPNQSYIVDSLAWALFKYGRVNESLTEIRRAVSLGGQVDSSIWEHYGDIASHMGLRDEARKAYQKALDLKPANAETLRQRLSQL
ncbi:MAG: tetratricopeptide repeat protein [Desulfovibrio sp.]|jgi:Flp pilus assembly protein TadD|nr:tetratricopeptide repeat protein [Desulfovibrio sp.]